MRFLLGFATASVLWALAAALLYTTDIVAILDDPPEEAAGSIAPDEHGPPGDGKRRRRVRRERVGHAPKAREGSARAEDVQDVPTGETTTGDDLDWNGGRRIDMAAGEAQLSGIQIEAGFDSVMGKIRRCLVLVPGSGDVTGKLIFGMRVGADGAPRAVNLTGPAAVTGGESGSCLRTAAQAIRFPKFDGPDMLFRYPITLH